MRYGLCLPTGGACGDPRFLVQLAERAEDTGWDGLFLEDYVCYQGDPATPCCNTWVALSAIAARTRPSASAPRSLRCRGGGRGTWRARPPPSTSSPTAA